MAKFLVVYGTVEGQTEKIAFTFADELRRLAHTVDVANVLSLPAATPIESYDGVIVGAPVHYSGYPLSVRRWVKSNVHALSEKPGAFFSVCLSVLQKDDAQVRSDERRIMNDFLSWSGWNPNITSIFAGALAYSKYSWLVRLVMKRISKKAGRETDTSRDYEYTDWEAVRRLARQFADLVAPETSATA